MLPKNKMRQGSRGVWRGARDEMREREMRREKERWDERWAERWEMRGFVWVLLSSNLDSSINYVRSQENSTWSQKSVLWVQNNYYEDVCSGGGACNVTCWCCCYYAMMMMCLASIPLSVHSLLLRHISASAVEWLIKHHLLAMSVLLTLIQAKANI